MTVISIPGWISSVVFLVTCYVSGFQHVRLKRVNPIMNLQFFMMAFALAMIWVNAVYDHDMPWLSLGFLLLAVGSLSLMIYQFRRMPARLPFQ